MKTWKILITAGWSAWHMGLQRMIYILAGAMVPFLIAWYFLGLLGLDVDWRDFIVHGEAAIVAIAATVAAALLVTRRRKHDDTPRRKNSNAQEFPDKTTFIVFILVLWILGTLTYTASLIAPKLAPPVDIAGNAMFVVWSIMLLLTAILISGIAEIVNTALDADFVRSMRI